MAVKQVEATRYSWRHRAAAPWVIFALGLGLFLLALIFLSAESCNPWTDTENKSRSPKTETAPRKTAHPSIETASQPPAPPVEPSETTGKEDAEPTPPRLKPFHPEDGAIVQCKAANEGSQEPQLIAATPPGPGIQVLQQPGPPLIEPHMPPLPLPLMPRHLDALEKVMPPRGENEPRPLGDAPRPSPAELKKFGDYVTTIGDPTNTLDLIKGRSRLMIVKSTPKKVQITDESIVTATVFSTTEITILGKAIGTTVLNMWFPSVEDKNKDVVLSYLVRVFPDPWEKERKKIMYEALERDINRTFHDSLIQLQLVGDKVVVTGQPHDIQDATQILRVISAATPYGGLTGSGFGNTGGAVNAANRGADKGPPVEGVQNSPRPEAPNAPGGATPGQENFLSSGNPNVINMMRVPGVQQVMLKVVVAEVNRTAARSIGLNFSLANGSSQIQNQTGSLIIPYGFGGGGASGFGLGSTLASAATSGLSNVSPFANIPVALSNGQIILAINALKSMHYAKSLAEPNLTTTNGCPASFLAGGQFPVPVVTGTTLTGLQGVSFVPYGVQLNFTPYITDKDRIRLSVSATVSTRDTTTGTLIGNSTVPGLTSRNFTSTIDLREGQTLAVAGLLQTNVGTDRYQLPFLGEIPLINRLTGFDSTSAGEQELVVLITPELVQPMKKGSEIPRLPGSDLFEPSDLEFYLLGRLEGRRTQDFRSPVMTDIHRIRQYNRCEQTYIFGASGYVTPDQNEK